MKWLMMLLVVAGLGATTRPAEPIDLVAATSLGMKEADLVKTVKPKLVAKFTANRRDGAHRISEYKLSNGSTIFCDRSVAYRFEMDPAVGMLESEFKHFNQSNRTALGDPCDPYCLYRTTFDSESSKLYKNEVHEVQVNKTSGKVSAVTNP